MKIDKVILVIVAIIIAIMCFAQVSLAPENFEPATEAGIIQSIASEDQDMQASLMTIGAGNFLLPFIAILGSGGVIFFIYLKRQNN